MFGSMITQTNVSSSPRLVGRLTLVIAPLAATLAIVASLASPPAADASSAATTRSAALGSLYNYNNTAHATYAYDVGYLRGTLKDLDAKDAKCARVYVKGWSSVGGWGGWKELKAVCAGGWASYSTFLKWYNEKVNLKVCAGYEACSEKRIAG